jgi:geranylgeranyl reductase family protein
MYDVIITGAGPAGSTCARECARNGLKTLLLDRDNFPRSKPCGGAISEQGLSHLDFPLPENIIERECFGIRVDHGGHTVAVRKNARFAVLVSRRDFDALLVDKAVEGGARFLSGEQVIHVQEQREIIEAATTNASHQAPFLIGADGVHSRIAQAVRPPFRKEETAVALVSHIPAGDREIRNSLDKTLYLRYGIAPNGYGWFFPHRNYYSAGVAGVASRFQTPRDVLHGLAQSLNIELTDIRGGFIPFGGIKRKVAAGRILLIGDAAGLGDPFHGEGIAHAIHSGKLAAQAIVDGIKNRRNPAAVVARYCRVIEQRIRKPLRVALRMANMLETYPCLFLRIFFDHPEALERYLDIASGKIDYLSFQRWLLVRIPRLLLTRSRRT